MEARGDKPARLTEKGFERWHLFRRRLGWWDFVALLHADAAQQYPVPFTFADWPDAPAAVPHEEAEAMVHAAATPDSSSSLDWLKATATALALPSLALSDAPKFRPEHRVLCLPGTAGRVAALRCLEDPSLDFGSQFTWVAPTTAERVAIGLAAVECKARVEPHRLLSLTDFEQLADNALARFDRVVGLKTDRDETFAARVGDRGRWL